VDRADLLFVVVPFLVLAALSTGSVLILRRRWRMDRAAMRHAARLVEPDIVTPPRDSSPVAFPRWANPWLWVGVSAAFAVLGFIVWPALFGGVFLFIPFVWGSRSKPRIMDPRSNGHAKREGPV
jgi:hypothetical protein